MGRKFIGLLFIFVFAGARLVSTAQEPAPGASKQPKDLPEVSHGPWVRSSYDLLDGADVTEDPDTVPDELFDELFPPKQDAPRNSKK